MMYCQDCLHIVPDGTLFCDQCGGAALRRTSLGPVAPRRAPLITPSQLPATDVTPATPLPIMQQLPAVLTRDDPTARARDHMSIAARRHLRLRLTNGKAFDLMGKTMYVIGRHDPHLPETPDVDLADWNGAACGVSRRHAVIHVSMDGITVEDLESLNETIRNGYRLLPHQRYPLLDNDELRLGSITLLVAILS